MTRKWQTMAFVMLLFLTLALAGCDPDEALKMPPGSAEPIASAPEKITVDVYWDATVSMQGFTKIAAGNVYRSLPDTLGDMGGALGEVHFFRFGEQVTPIEGRAYRDFSNPETYTEKITSFGTVLDTANPEHLSIVVTDLFESEADWSNVTQKLRDKYFSQHLAVGIIGIKNSFSGDIFDVGLNAASFHYDSGEDPARFRPFYLFLMGPEAQVRTFLDKWNRQQIPASDMQYVVFSEHFATQTSSLRLADAKGAAKKNIFEDKQLSKEDDRLQEAGIADRKEMVELTIPGKLQLYPYSCVLNADALEKRVKIFTLDDENNWQEQQGRWQQQESKGASVSFKLLEDNACELGLSFPPEGTLPKGKVDLLEVQVVPTRQSMSLPSWIAEWDMGDIDTAPEQFNGAKTANLRRLADSLKESLLAAAQPTLVELDIVVDSR